VVLAGSAWSLSERLPRIPASAGVDLLPLWLGARALLAGLDPNDVAVQERMFREAGLAMRVGGFWSYYPPTAPVLFLPVAGVGFKALVPVWRWIAVGLLVLTGWLGSGRLRAGAWVAAALLQLRVAGVVLPSAQPGPLVTAWTAATLAALAARRDRLAGLCLGVGAAVKLVPLALLLPLLATRRWSAIAVATATLLVAMAIVLVMVPDWSARAWATNLLHFVDGPMLDPWLRQEPAWVLALWRARAWGPGLGTLLVCGLAARRRAAPQSLPALAVAWVGVIMAGSHHYHEALVLLPAVAWALGRGGWMSVVTAILLVATRTWDHTSPPSALHWIVAGWGVWTVLAVDCVRALRGARPA
jgi:hypothetical protein